MDSKRGGSVPHIYKVEKAGGEHVGPHSMGDSWKQDGSHSADTSTENSIQKDFRHYQAFCTSCAWRGADNTVKRLSDDEAAQHQIDYPGHSASVQLVPQP